MSNSKMHNLSFINDLNVDHAAESKLVRLLENAIYGDNSVIATPYLKASNEEEILAKWNKVFFSNKSKLNNTLLDLEESNKMKIGPRSIQKPWNERKDSVYQYFHNDKDSDVPKIQKTLYKGSLRPLSSENAISFLKNDTSSGLPWVMKKKFVKERLLNDFTYYLDRKDPCIMFTRTQEQGKTRSVWGFPAADTLNEMKYYRPLLGYQKKLNWRAALLGPNEVSSHITRLINSANSSGNLLVSVDFSAYDASISKSMIKNAFNYIKDLYQPKYWEELDYICDRFHNIGLITPDGVINGNHGVPSGSTFTNEVDSIVQYQAHEYLGFVDMETLQIQGDDGAVSIREGSENNFFESLESYGLNINKEKSYIAKDYIVFLQNLYHMDYMQKGIINGIYPTYRALNRIMYQERWSDFEKYGITGQDYYSIRTISILENCKHHPLFEELVKFVIDLDKYKLKVSEKGIADYIRMMEAKSGSEGILINQYSDNIKGIRSFDTYKMVKEIG